jgi:DNA-directed RNA polymerase specialized sigma24 family protein
MRTAAFQNAIDARFLLLRTAILNVRQQKYCQELVKAIGRQPAISGLNLLPKQKQHLVKRTVEAAISAAANAPVRLQLIKAGVVSHATFRSLEMMTVTEPLVDNLAHLARSIAGLFHFPPNALEGRDRSIDLAVLVADLIEKTECSPDLLQSALLKALEALADDPGKDVKAVRRKAFNYLKTGRQLADQEKIKFVPAGLRLDQAEEASPSELIDLRWKLTMIDEAMKRLPAKPELIIRLRLEVDNEERLSYLADKLQLDQQKVLSIHRKPQPTLDDVADLFNICKERLRQIEMRALMQTRSFIKREYPEYLEEMVYFY